MRKTVLLTLAIVLLLPFPQAWACPYCESDIGKEVAAGIFNDDFAFNAALTLLPIPVLLLIVYFMYFGMPLPKAARRHDTPLQLDQTTASHEILELKHEQ